jgi:hypothetical protein
VAAGQDDIQFYRQTGRGYQDVEVELPPNWNPEVDHAFVVLSPNGKTGFNFSFEEAVKFGKELLHLSDIMRHGGSSA